jgi:outer membrane lipoprotein carrier protein
MAYFPLIPLILLAQAAPAPLAERLHRIETRYNSLRTLRSEFEQSLAVAQGRRVIERGTLSLRKPGQMRWEYSQPAGKIFVSDGKQIFFLSSSARRLEISSIKETEDLRIPLAFLIGRLDFQRDFQRYEESPQPNGTKIRAIPRSSKSPFEYIEFIAAADGRLLFVNVQSKDGSTMAYSFQNEVLNPALSPSLFTLSAPEGFEVLRLRQPQ